MYEEGEVPSPAMSEVLVPVLIYSATYLTGLLGNILILVAVTGQKQVRCYTKLLLLQNGTAESRFISCNISGLISIVSGNSLCSLHLEVTVLGPSV